MIFYLTTFLHRGTQAPVLADVPQFRRVPYPLLFLRRSLPRGTYIFSDLDRLGFWELEVAAFYYRELADAGCRVLNDPARALHRLDLLRMLNRTGLNRFKAWAAIDFDEVDRFPVFIRTARAHRGLLTDLIDAPGRLREELRALVDRGYPQSDLIVVEYCAEPLREGLFQKPSVYRVGDQFVACPSVHESHWMVKQGNPYVAVEEEYGEDLARLRENPHADFALQVFDIASIEFGRLDIGVVGGAPQAYEINTNPAANPDLRYHPSPSRMTALNEGNRAYRSALAALDTVDTGKRVRIGKLRTVEKRARFGGRAAFIGLP